MLPVVLFGAAVRPDGTLSEAAWQRAEATLRLYRAGIAGPILVSGTGAANDEVRRMADHLRAGGVPTDQITEDPWGVDSGDTCRHAASQGWPEAILVTQRYHLPRVMKLCADAGLRPWGFDAAAAPLDATPSLWTKATVRAGRALRESGLLWLHLLGVYGRLSREAEEAGA